MHAFQPFSIIFQAHDPGHAYSVPQSFYRTDTVSPCLFSEKDHGRRHEASADHIPPSLSEEVCDNEAELWREHIFS